MTSPFDLPRADCSFVPTVDDFEPTTHPMTPKPKSAGAASYDDPAYPSGGGPDDVPAAAPPIGQALPASMVPPAQTSLGGGGGETIKLVRCQSNGTSGNVSVKDIVPTTNAANIPNWEESGDAYTIRYLTGNI